MLELSFLFISIIIVCVILYYQADDIDCTEPFDQYSLSACPSGYTLFYSSNGTASCCKGEVKHSKCYGTQQCTLGSGENNCATVLLKEYKEKGATNCPVSMSSYYEDLSQKIKGCTNGPLNQTLTGPRDSSQPKCSIYSTMDDNQNKIDSCLNQKHLDEYSFGYDCTKAYIQPVPGAPPLLSIGFIDTTGMHHMANTRESSERFLNKVTPNWKELGIDLSRNIQVAEVAKAFYLDKTISQADIQL